MKIYFEVGMSSTMLINDVELTENFFKTCPKNSVNLAKTEQLDWLFQNVRDPQTTAHALRPNPLMKSF